MNPRRSATGNCAAALVFPFHDFKGFDMRFSHVFGLLAICCATAIGCDSAKENAVENAQEQTEEAQDAQQDANEAQQEATEDKAEAQEDANEVQQDANEEAAEADAAKTEAAATPAP